MFVGTSWAAVDTRAATARNALQFEWEVSRTGGAAASLITTALDQAAARARGEGGRPYPGTAFRRVRGWAYLAAAATSSWHGPVNPAGPSNWPSAAPTSAHACCRAGSSR